jgi:protein phosphatase
MVADVIPYKVEAYGLSDIGLVRQNNEDVWAELVGLGFYALADGMGGHQAGEVASRETIKALCRIIKKKMGFKNEGRDLESIQQSLKLVIEQVNSFVYKLGRSQRELKGMGTTLCCLLFHERGLIYAHVGDSRIYRFRQNKLQQITRDHSLFRELVDQGHIDEQQAPDFLNKNIITKAIGTDPRTQPTVNAADIQIDDIYLMCSDGLSDLLSPAEMSCVVSSASSLQEAVHALIAMAKAKGGHDNITVVLTRVEKFDEVDDLSGS